jgi:hypothetical protein
MMVACLIGCACGSHAPPIEFRREHVTIEISDDHVTVVGIYLFHNTCRKTQCITFFYPFPIDSNHYYPDTLLISYPYTRTANGIYYDMVIQARTSKACTISYVQRTHYPEFTYITTTTKEWKRPIEQADFTIIAPDTLLVTMNYPVHDRVISNAQCINQIRYQNFYPTEDLIIHWSMNP